MISIPEIAQNLVEKDLQEHDVQETSLFLMGSKSVGKSTLLNSFLDKNEPPRETLVVDYSYGRKTSQKQSLEKHICHVWEYGGNLEMMKSVLSSVPLRGKIIKCVMVDLSKIRHLWKNLEACLWSLKDAKDNSVETVIIGGKYDIFKNFDSDIKKVICNTLRCVALLYDSHLFYYSSKEPALVRRGKDILQGMTFGNGFPTKEKSTNVNKPLFLQKKMDSWENVGVASSSIEEIKRRHLSLIPAEVEVPKPAEARGNQTYPEPLLDSLVRTKLEELTNYFTTITI